MAKWYCLEDSKVTAEDGKLAAVSPHTVTSSMAREKTYTS